MMKLAYFRMLAERDRYLGGIMVADTKGVPIEFKYTDVIKPTKMQKVLYGDTLEKYLKEEVIMGKLVEVIENTPDLYIVDSINDFVLKEFVEDNLVVLRHTKLNSLDKVNDYQFLKANEAIVQLVEKDNPVRAIFSESKKDEIIEKIINFNVERDILEPLDRIEEALNLVCEGEL